jgi:nucleoside 2-deoxyribosyltransferase
MNIYFSCSITGGRNDQKIYKIIVDYLLNQGHEVPTAHLSNEDILSVESVVEPMDVYRRDVKWVNECDALVAEVSTPSHGVGYEIALALTLKKPVLCCHQKGRRVSKMLTGNTHPGFKLAAYADASEIIQHLSQFLDEIK